MIQEEEGTETEGYWFIVAFFVILIVVALFWLTWNPKPQVNKNTIVGMGSLCGQYSKCADGLTCEGTCKISEGRQCKLSSQCQSNHICSGICIESIPTGDVGQPIPCNNYVEMEEVTLESGLIVCKKKKGVSCTLDQECSNSLCLSGVCHIGNDIGSPCSSNPECKENLDCSNGICQYRGKITGSAGSYCNGTCSNRLTCVDNICVEPTASYGQDCSNGGICESPYICSSHSLRCEYPENPNDCSHGTCDKNFTCSQGICISNQPNGMCSVDPDCSSNSCSQGPVIYRRPLTQPSQWDISNVLQFNSMIRSICSSGNNGYALTKDYVTRFIIGTGSGFIPIVPRCSKMMENTEDLSLQSYEYEINCIASTPYPYVLMVGGSLNITTLNTSMPALTSRTKTQGILMYLQSKKGNWNLKPINDQLGSIPIDGHLVGPIIGVSCSTLGTLITDSSRNTYLLDEDCNYVRTIGPINQPRITNIVGCPISYVENGYIILGNRRYPNGSSLVRNRRILDYDITSYSEGFINIAILLCDRIVGEDNTKVIQVNMDHEELSLPGYTDSRSLISLTEHDVLILNHSSCSSH